MHPKRSEFIFEKFQPKNIISHENYLPKNIGWRSTYIILVSASLGVPEQTTIKQRPMKYSSFLWFDDESYLSLCALRSILPIFTDIAVASGNIPSFHTIFKLIKRACYVKICWKTIPNFRPLVSDTL